LFKGGYEGAVALLVLIFNYYLIPDFFFAVLVSAANLICLYLSRSDWQSKLLPLSGLMWLFVVGIAVQFTVKNTLPSFFIMGALGLLLQKGYKVLRQKDGLGTGDVILLSLCGLFLEPTQLPLFLVASGGFAVLIKWIYCRNVEQETFPFAPAISLSLWVTVLFGQYASFN
jgi:leader peptidase (prepilin peptidase)/N-methyltransferase